MISSTLNYLVVLCGASWIGLERFVLVQHVLIVVHVMVPPIEDHCLNTESNGKTSPNPLDI